MQKILIFCLLLVAISCYKLVTNSGTSGNKIGTEPFSGRETTFFDNFTMAESRTFSFYFKLGNLHLFSQDEGDWGYLFYVDSSAYYFSGFGLAYRFYDDTDNYHELIEYYEGPYSNDPNPPYTPYFAEQYISVNILESAEEDFNEEDVVDNWC